MAVGVAAPVMLFAIRSNDGGGPDSLGPRQGDQGIVGHRSTHHQLIKRITKFGQLILRKVRPEMIRQEQLRAHELEQ